MISEEIQREIDRYIDELEDKDNYDSDAFVDVVNTWLINNDDDSVDFILRNYWGKYKTVEDFIEEYLIDRNVENQLMNCEYFLGNHKYYLGIESLNLTKMWENNFKLSGSFTGYRSEETGWFYVWSKFQ